MTEPTRTMSPAEHSDLDAVMREHRGLWIEHPTPEAWQAAIAIKGAGGWDLIVEVEGIEGDAVFGYPAAFDTLIVNEAATR